MVDFAPDPQQQIRDSIMGMCQGNPGAIGVLASIPQQVGAREALQLFAQMKEMNIVGPNVWLAFKDASGLDITKMIDSIRANDPKMIEAINQWAPPESKAKLRAAKSGG